MKRKCRRFELLTPTEIVTLRDECPVAFQPISSLEWHSYHLPMGTDVIIADGLAERIADEVGGLLFPPIWMGLDAWRPEEQKKRWRLPVEFSFFGMNMDSLPLRSEYHDLSLVREVLTHRIEYVRDCGFRLRSVVGHQVASGHFKSRSLHNTKGADTVRLCSPSRACRGTSSAPTTGYSQHPVGESVQAWTDMLPALLK